MAVLPMRLLSGVMVTWPPGDPVGMPARAGSVVAIDLSNAALVTAYGGAGNLQDVSALPGDDTAIDSGAQTN
jgi:hypothetical protein